MFDKSVSTSHLSYAMRAYSPHTSGGVTSAQKRRAFISFIVSRERSKRAARDGLRCYSVDPPPPTPPPFRAYSAMPYTSPILTVTSHPSARRPKFIFSHSGNNLEKEQRDKDSRLKDDSGAVLPSTAAAAASLKNGTYINGFRPMNSRNNFLGGQGITPLQTQTPPQRAVNNSSNTSSSHSK